jgi:hypothetical protein
MYTLVVQLGNQLSTGRILHAVDRPQAGFVASRWVIWVAYDACIYERLLCLLRVTLRGAGAVVGGVRRGGGAGVRERMIDCE